VLSFEEARERLLARVERLEVERVPLSSAASRVLAEPVVASGDLPPFSYSAMDGYALGPEGLSAAGPFELAVVGESRAGRVPTALAPGTACRILTGAELPSGADRVVAQEDVERHGDRITLAAAPRAFQHVRRAAEDIRRGDTAFATGARLGPAELALLASLDVTEVAVSRRPRVTVLPTGDELRTPGSPAVPGKIPDSLSLPLSTLAGSAGAVTRVAPFVVDEPGATERAIRAALDGADLLVTIGGVSVGDHDLVRPALEAEGVVLDFWKVAIKPGKPLASGRHAKSGALVLALPGNPASAMITFSLFGMPLVRALQGDGQPEPRTVPLPLAAPYRKKSGRLEFARVRIEPGPDGPRARPLENQASGALTSLAWSDALALIPAETEELAAGERVEVLRFQDL
jgi:molybdopterin molybdotransferase